MGHLVQPRVVTRAEGVLHAGRRRLCFIPQEKCPIFPRGSLNSQDQRLLMSFMWLSTMARKKMSSHQSSGLCHQTVWMVSRNRRFQLFHQTCRIGVCKFYMSWWGQGCKIVSLLMVCFVLGRLLYSSDWPQTISTVEDNLELPIHLSPLSKNQHNRYMPTHLSILTILCNYFIHVYNVFWSFSPQFSFFSLPLPSVLFFSQTPSFPSYFHVLSLFCDHIV